MLAMVVYTHVSYLLLILIILKILINKRQRFMPLSSSFKFINNSTCIPELVMSILLFVSFYNAL